MNICCHLEEALHNRMFFIFFIFNLLCILFDEFYENFLIAGITFVLMYDKKFPQESTILTLRSVCI
jgi:hypothetical protein